MSSNSFDFGQEGDPKVLGNEDKLENPEVSSDDLSVYDQLSEDFEYSKESSEDKKTSDSSQNDGVSI